MLDYTETKDPQTGGYIIETSLYGKPLLMTPQLNKGTAFTEQERDEFNLVGKLPIRVESLEEQVTRAYRQYNSYQSKLNKNIYLNSLLDNNQTVFYKLVADHLIEMLPIIYTPIVGTAVKEYSQEYRHPRGLYISYPERAKMKAILNNRSNPAIDVIVVTDGEGVLGIGDQGLGGMDIPIAKLMVYTLCAGINPNRTLPILLDVGTNNETLLQDPMYLGWRHERLSGQDYDDFIDQFVTEVKKTFPNVFLHWEDFGRENARRNLDRFRNNICTFNDDMQGTGVVTLSAILAAVRACGRNLRDERIVVFGAGTAGTGIADQIADAMVHEGLTYEQAHQHVWLLDRAGLLVENMSELTAFQQKYARKAEEISTWDTSGPISLLDVVKHVKPTILIGSSAVPNAFTEEVVRTMQRYVKRPIILPLSNPTERIEASPSDLYHWTNGEVLVATGSPFDDVQFDNRLIRIAQCNNALVFPGIGLGLIAVKAKSLSDQCLWAATNALSEFAPVTHDPYAALLPNLDMAKEVAQHIALAVATQVVKEGNSQIEQGADLLSLIKSCMWKPHYAQFKRRANHD